MIWNFSGMVWHTYLSIKSFQTKPDLAQKKCNQQLAKRKKMHTQKQETPTHHSIVQQPFCFHLVSSVFFTPDVQRAMMTMMSMSSSYAPGGSPIHRSGIFLLYHGWNRSGFLRWISRGPAGGYLVDPSRMAMAVACFPFWVPWGGWSSSGQKRAVLRGAWQLVGMFFLEDWVNNFCRKKKPGIGVDFWVKKQ